MNEPLNQFQQDRTLLDDFQRELVTRMRQRLRNDDLSNADLCKFADKCADFQKLANDREKTAIAHERTAIARERVIAYERRTSAHDNIAHGRNETQLEIVRLRVEAAKVRGRPDHPRVDEDDPEAPYGRKKDGTPYTQDEFRDSLNQAIREIWGLPPINPENIMPDGWNGDDDSAIRARSASDGADPTDKREPSPSRDPFVIRKEFTRRGGSFEIPPDPPIRDASSRHSPDPPTRKTSPALDPIVPETG